MYIQTYDKLGVACLTPEMRDRTCGYWYCVSNYSTPHTAFRTREAFDQWLRARDLSIDAELPAQGEYAYFPIIGGYRSAMYLDRDAWDKVDGCAYLHMSNARYTLAFLARDSDGVMVEHYLNPNVADRPEYDHAVARELEDAGHAQRIPGHISGRPPYNPRYVAYATAHGCTVDGMLAADKLAWPGGHMCGFILWNRARIAEFSKAHPEAFMCGNLVDHRAYDAWLAEFAAAASARP